MLNSYRSYKKGRNTAVATTRHKSEFCLVSRHIIRTVSVSHRNSVCLRSSSTTFLLKMKFLAFSIQKSAIRHITRTGCAYPETNSYPRVYSFQCWTMVSLLLKWYPAPTHPRYKANVSARQVSILLMRIAN